MMFQKYVKKAGLVIMLFVAWTGVCLAAPDQTVESGRLVDQGYGFELVKPSDAWQIMDEKKVSSLSPDAVAGVVNLNQKVFLVVLPELAADADLEKFAKMALNNMPLEEKQIYPVGTVKINGSKGYRYFITGRIEAVKFSYVCTVFKRHDIIFQVLSWKLHSTDDVDREQLIMAQIPFRFLENVVPKARERASAEEITGIGWRVKNRVYENAVNGLRMHLPEGWRFADMRELKSMTPDASLGLVNGKSGDFCVFIIERLGEIDPEQYEAQSVKNFLAENTVGSYQVSQRNINGQKFKVHHFEKTAVDDVLIDYAITFRAHNGLVFRVINWWVHASQKKGASHLNKVYQGISWLSREEQATLRTQLLKWQHIDRSVSPTEYFRNNVYTNFDYGLTIDFPDGFWTHTMGQMARAENEEVSLKLTHLETDLNMVMVLEATDEFQAEEYHKVVLRNFDHPNGSQSEKMKIPNAQVWSTKFVQMIDRMPVEFHLITSSHGNRHAQILFTRIKNSNREAEAIKLAIVNGIQWSDKKMVPVSFADNGVLTDQRLGFSVHKPDNDYQIKDVSPEQIRPIGTLISIERQGKSGPSIKSWYNYVIGAFHTDYDIRMLAEQIIKSNPAMKARGYRLASRKEVTWFGYPCDEYRYKSSLGPVNSMAIMRCFSVGGTGFFYLAFSNKGVLPKEPDFKVLKLIN